MKGLSNTNNLFKISKKSNFPLEYLVSEQGNLYDLQADT